MQKNNILKLCMFMLVFLLSFSIVNAEMYFKPNTDAVLSVSCYNNGLPCTAGSCNISKVVDPTGVIILSNVAMTHLGSQVFSYNVSLGNTLGIYSYDLFCVDGTEANVYKGTFEVTHSGSEKDSNLLMISYLIIISLIIVYFISGFMLGKQHSLMKISLFFGSLINLLGGLIMVYIEYYNAYATSYMILTIFIANSIFVTGLVGYYFYYIIMHNIFQDEDESV